MLISTIHLHASLLGIPRYYWVGCHFAFRTPVILHGIELSRCRKLHVDMIISHICYRSPIPPHPTLYWTDIW